MKVIVMAAFAAVLGGIPARANSSADAVLRSILSFHLRIAHCKVAFHGDMARELKSQMQRLQLSAALDDTAVRQIARGLYEEIGKRVDCDDVRATAIPTALELVQAAHRIP